MNQFLTDARRILSGTPDIRTALQRLAAAIVPRLADFCLIFVVRGNDLRCVASAHVDREGQRLLRGLTRVYRITRDDPVSTVALVVRTGRPRLRTEIRSEPADLQQDLRVFRLHRRLGARSVLVVPIGPAPHVRGAISLSYAGSGRHYTTQELATARRLAAITAAALGGRAPVRPQAALVTRRPLRLRARA